MSFFGRPVNQIFDSNVVTSALFGGGLGAVEGYIEARARHDEHPWRRVATTAATWAGFDAATEVGLNVFSPGIRGAGGIRSALVSAGIGASTGAVAGYTQAKIHHEDHPLARAFSTAAGWAAIDGSLELGMTPFRNRFPGSNGGK